MQTAIMEILQNFEFKDLMLYYVEIIKYLNYAIVSKNNTSYQNF